MKYVCYYRVSTDKQGESGLGLESQKSICEKYLDGRGSIIRSFVEVESGRNNKRPEFQKALEFTNLSGATLVVAKLDRLARNAAFLLKLKESGTKFICVDMPEMNGITFAVMSALAQQEAETTSSRTKSALEAKKARGETWVRHKFKKEERMKGVTKSATQKNEASKPLREMCQALHRQGKNYVEIQLTLTGMGLLSRNNRPISLTRISNYSRRDTW